MAVQNPGGGSTVAIPNDVVYTGSSPGAWAALDLSAIVGSELAIVLLKIASTDAGSATAYRLRPNGDTADYQDTGAGGGVAIANTEAVLLIIATDATGKIEWDSTNVRTCVVTLVAYMKP